MTAAPHTDDDAIASPWRSEIFRSIWIANLASNFGGLIQTVGAAWLMTALGASSQLIALVQTATVLPIMLLSLPAGALADSHDRRILMLIAQVFMLVVSAALAICAVVGVLNPWLLLGFTFLIGCGTSLKNPAWQASVGDMVPRPALPAAVAMNGMGFNIARSLGPAIGGVIVAALGAAAAFAINAVSYIGLIAVLVRWKQPQAPKLLPPERLGVAIEAGLRYVAMSPNLRVVLIRAATFGIGASAIPALMPLIARDLVGGGALVYGLLLGAFGIGAVGGAFGRNRFRVHLSNEQLVRAAGVALAVGAGVSAISPFAFVTLPALALAGAGWVLALSTFNVSVQLASPRWVVARTLSLYQMAVFGGMAAGSAVFGWLTDTHGVAASLLVAAGAQIAALVLGLFLTLPDTESLDLDPLDRFREPETAVPIEPRSGPIVVTVEYRIPEARLVAFLTAMAERRRIRRRDGAHGWRLLRDLGDEAVWIERYHVATWLDYVRHNTRRTRADLANTEMLHRLQDENEPLRVHRMIERQTGALPGAPSTDPRELVIDDPTANA